MHGVVSDFTSIYVTVCYTFHYHLPVTFIANMITSRLVHKIVTRSGAAFNLILDRVMPIIDSETKNWDEPAHMKELTLLHVLTEETRQSRDYWDPKTLTQSMLGLLLGASHQPWVNLHVFLYRLCQSLEWQDILREEIFAAQETGPLDYEKLSQLPLLDSFMRETARIVSLDRSMFL